MSQLFPTVVVVIERRLPGDTAELLASEAHYVARARQKRQQEFAAGRSCARAALAEFGVAGFALHAAEDRQPVWPDAYVGSITHTTGLCAAAVAPRAQLLALGLDSEIVGAPSTDIWSTICREEELAWIDSLPTEDRPAAVTLVFSAKEAVYKCQYPLVAEWLDFHDLHVRVGDWGLNPGTFTAVPTRRIKFSDHVGSPIAGRHVFHGPFVSAGVAIPAGQ